MNKELKKEIFLKKGRLKRVMFDEVKKQRNAKNLRTKKSCSVRLENMVYKIKSLTRKELSETQRQTLKEAISSGLTRNERLAIILHYYEEMSFKEIGLSLEIPEEEARELHESALEQIKYSVTTKLKK